MKIKAIKSRAVIGVPRQFIEDVAQRAAELVAERLALRKEKWVGVEAVAAHLSCSTHRVHRLVSLRRIPFAKDGPRLLFRLSEVDAWLSNGGAEIQ
jgi:excisionase family DNA binding protein